MDDDSNGECHENQILPAPNEVGDYQCETNAIWSLFLPRFSPLVAEMVSKLIDQEITIKTPSGWDYSYIMKTFSLLSASEFLMLSKWNFAECREKPGFLRENSSEFCGEDALRHCRSSVAMSICCCFWRSLSNYGILFKFTFRRPNSCFKIRLIVSWRIPNLDAMVFSEIYGSYSISSLIRVVFSELVDRPGLGIELSSVGPSRKSWVHLCPRVVRSHPCHRLPRFRTKFGHCRFFWVKGNESQNATPHS
jgi:hypothetical protein